MLLLLVANTRTGTTALGQGLAASNREVVTCGEVFHTQAVEDTSFRSWLARHQVAMTHYIDESARLQADYLQWLIDHHRGQSVIIDMKYHDIAMLQPWPALADFPPHIFRAVGDMGGKVVHLVRDDKCSAAISQVVANRRNLHHRKAGEPDVKVEPFDIPWWQLEAQIRLRFWSESMVRLQLANAAVSPLTLSYEHVFGKDQDTALASLSQFVGMRLSLSGMSHERLSEGYRDIVRNLDDLHRHYNAEDWTRLPVTDDGQ